MEGYMTNGTIEIKTKSEAPCIPCLSRGFGCIADNLYSEGDSGKEMIQRVETEVIGYEKDEAGYWWKVYSTKK